MSPPPDNENGPQGAYPETRSNDQMAVHDTSKIAPRTDRRHVPEQLPLVRSATVHEPFPGQKRAMVLPDDVCPDCGFKRLHWSEWPAPALLHKRCRCGCGYELTLYPMRAKRRGARKVVA